MDTYNKYYFYYLSIYVHGCPYEQQTVFQINTHIFLHGGGLHGGPSCKKGLIFYRCPLPFTAHLMADWSLAHER